MVRFPVILAALATWILGCAAGDTGAPSYNNADASLNSDTKAIPPGADSPYPPDNTPVAKPDVPMTPEPDTGPADPCASWRDKSGMMYRCTFENNGLSDICNISLEVRPDEGCFVRCDPALRDVTTKIELQADGQTFNYKNPNDMINTVCVPVQ